MGNPQNDQAHDDDQARENTSAAAAGNGFPAAGADAGAAANGPGGPRADLRTDLPMIEAPKLGGADAGGKSETAVAREIPKFAAAEAIPILAGERISGPSRESEADAALRAQPHPLRFALLAATIALAAGGGSFLGALTIDGFGRHPAAASAALARTAERHETSPSLKAQLAELSALKASLDGANRSASAQLAKISERLDSLERAQADRSTKLTHLADTLDRLQKQLAAAPETTGSIPTPARAKAPEPDVAAPVLTDWIVQDVRNGRAMVESRYGGLFLVGAGSMLPGLGRVEQVKRQDGRWVVVTASGLITSPR